MRSLWRRFQIRHIWLLCAAALIGVFFLLRGNRALMNGFAARVTTPVKEFLAALSYSVRWSVMELMLALFAAAALVYIGFTVIRLIRRKDRGARLYGFFLTVLCVAATIYAGFCFLWGVYYYTDSFQDESGIRAEEVSAEELYAVTRYFADRLIETADTVKRDENGVFAVPRTEIFADAAQVYTHISAEIPCLSYPDRTPKAMCFSKLMSLLDFTGVYFPFAGESNLNADSPACMLPATIAHELGHQRGIASEKECNFTAVLASTTADSPAYRYSGWLLGYVYLGNALYAADQELWQTVRDTLPQTVRADLADNSAYWEPYRDNALTKAYQQVYDKFLKSYGQTHGIKTYGLVVELLVVYYRDAAAQADGVSRR